MSLTRRWMKPKAFDKNDPEASKYASVPPAAAAARRSTVRPGRNIWKRDLRRAG